jgi:hypothetical protein
VSLLHLRRSLEQGDVDRPGRVRDRERTAVRGPRLELLDALETEHVAVPAFGRGPIVHVDMNVVDIKERRCSVGHRGTMRGRASNVRMITNTAATTASETRERSGAVTWRRGDPSRS